MIRILVTGGTGSLGRELVPLALRAGYKVRVVSRRARPEEVMTEVEWARADLEKGEGLDEATRDVNVVVHAATSPFKRTENVDVNGTRRLLERARSAKVEHFIFPSIVGIDQIPFPYYRHKLAAESVVRGGNVPWSILRATQFHSLIDGFLTSLSRIPFFLPLAADFRFQSVDAREVSAQLIECMSKGPAGMLPGFGGPEVLALVNMARVWMEVRRIRRLPVPIVLPGPVARAFRQGLNTAPAHAHGKITWREWLKYKYLYRDGRGGAPLPPRSVRGRRSRSNDRLETPKLSPQLAPRRHPARRRLLAVRRYCSSQLERHHENIAGRTSVNSLIGSDRSFMALRV